MEAGPSKDACGDCSRHHGDGPCPYVTPEKRQTLPGRPPPRKPQKAQNFKCEICDKAFSTRGRLTLHTTIHTGEKRYTCQHCAKGFNSKFKLVRHMVVHSRLRVCSDIQKEYKRRDILLTEEMKITVKNMKLSEENIKIIPNAITPKSVIDTIVDSTKQDEAFYVMDVGDVVRKHNIWLNLFPRVKPFYAVKCNDSMVVLRVLNALGTGFDCASKGEIARVLSLGVCPERIVFANPTKPASHIKYAAKVGVEMMTFDNPSELFKIKEYHPKAKLILRIRSDARDAQCPLGMKFGAEPSAISGLITTAIDLGLELVGVSFHVGSGCRDPSAFPAGVKAATSAIAEMVYRGADPYVLDIGGGFTEDSFLKVTTLVNEALESVGRDITIIAEPGRFYVDSAYTLATAIHGARNAEYYINDGVYGSFNCVLYDHAAPHPIPLKNTDDKLIPYKIWGPTCDSLDMVTDNALLPYLEIGDWLVWENMGAYTIAAASTFNGFPVPNVFYIASEDVWKYLEKITGFSAEEIQTSCGQDIDFFDDTSNISVQVAI